MGKNEESLNQLKLARQIGLRAKSHHIKFMCFLTEAHFAVDYGIIMRNGESENRDGMDKPCLSVPEASGASEKQGLDALREAMSLGREHGIVNCFGWRPDVVPRLCVNALDAGIEVPYVQRLIRTRHLVPVTPPLGCENWPWPLRICTLGRFAILRDEVPIHFGGKVQHKPMELLKAIISFGGKEGPKDTLVDILWPNAEGDMARQAFDTTLHRLRRLTGNDKAIRLKGEQLSLDARYCWIDIRAFEYLNLCIMLGNYLEQRGQWQTAVEHCLRAIEIDDLAEEFYRRLMVCYQRLGQRAKAIEVYQRLKNTLSAAFRISPSPGTNAVYRALLSEDDRETAG